MLGITSQVIHTKRTKAGFTLMELLIATSIFSIIALFATGSLVIIFESSRKSNSTRAVMTNLNFAFENMSREIRFGTRYHCGNTGSDSEPQDCTNGDTYITFQFDEDEDGTFEQVYYRIEGSELQRKVGAGNNWQPITSGDVNLTYGRFYVTGTTVGDEYQPRVLVVMVGQSGPPGTETETEFYLQNTLTQRLYDQ